MARTRMIRIDSIKCRACHQKMYGRYKQRQTSLWHQDCFRCSVCEKLITNKPDEAVLSGDGKLYHPQCYHVSQHPECDVCHRLIPADERVKTEDVIHPFWFQVYCPFHVSDNTPKCFSCQRMLPVESRHITLEDGRMLCSECWEFAIMDTDECQPLYLSVGDYFESIHMKINQQIPMLLVEPPEFIKAMEGERKSDVGAGILGLCLSKEKTVQSAHRRRKIRRNRVLGWEEYMGIESYPRELISRFEVTGILVLYGLPRLFTGAILARELMHAWLRLNNYRNMNPQAEQGICEVVAYMWLESQVMAMATSSSPPSNSMPPPPPVEAVKRCDDFEKKLGEFYLYKMANRGFGDNVEGFRAAKATIEKFGLQSALQLLEWHRTFPVLIRSGL